jgi:hypothetical protein
MSLLPKPEEFVNALPPATVADDGLMPAPDRQ